VNDRIKVTYERPRQRRRIGDVALHDLDGWIWMWLEVDYSNVRTGARQRGHYVAADESRAAGD
jgi:hypothetical protein